MDFERTGVFVEGDELKELVELANRAQRTPVIAFSSAHALDEGGLSGQAWSAFYKRLGECAKERGLPEPEGEYGIDGETGEILATPRV